MKLPIFQVDAFTDRPFQGNPAAVCVLSESKDDAWMQNLAQEMNLSETAFLLKQSEGYSLRWFTPTVEVDLCGHATLASAHVLWSEEYLKPDEEAKFQTRSGLLTAKKQEDWIELNFPASPVETVTTMPELSEALGGEFKYVGKSQSAYVLVEVESEEIVRSLTPDFKLLKTVPIHGAIVTSRAEGSEYDFVSRFFAPQMGIDEDPVTGSAHCCLAPFWRDRLGRDEMLAYQASPRGGVLRVRYSGDRVYIAGQAVTVFRGQLC